MGGRSAACEEVGQGGDLIGGGFGLGGADGGLLEGDEFGDAFLAEGEETGELVRGEGGFFAGALDLDEFAGFGDDEVSVDGGVAVFDVVEVEEGFVFEDAGADGGDEFCEGRAEELLFFDETVESDGAGDAGTGDGGGAGAAVGLKDIAIDPDGALAEDG